MTSSNGHGRDDGAERDARPVKPCCRRLGPGQWCTRDDKHDGPCSTESPPAHFALPNYGPGRKS